MYSIKYVFFITLIHTETVLQYKTFAGLLTEENKCLSGLQVYTLYENHRVYNALALTLDYFLTNSCEEK